MKVPGYIRDIIRVIQQIITIYPNPIGTNGSEMHYAMAVKPSGMNLDDPSVIWKTPNDKITSPGSNKIIPGVGSGMTNHGSIVEFKGNWYVFYHNAKLSDGGLRKLSICMDKLDYNSNGTIKESTITSEGMGTSAYSRIKAQFCTLNGINNNEDCGGGDIGKRVSYIDNGDKLGCNLDFGSIGAISFEARVASNNSSGGTIEIWRIKGRGETKIGSVQVNNTGGWGDNAENWTTVSCDFTYATYGEYYISLRFVCGSGGLMNLNWFKFKPSQNIPVGYSVAFKPQNPNCIDNNNNQEQKYLNVHTVNGGSNPNVCAVGGAWEKFSIISRDPGDSGLLNTLIQLNSSNNGKNIKLLTPSGSGGGNPINIYADGSDYFSLPVPNPSEKKAFNESFYWLPNNDGTISLKNRYNNKYLCVDSNNGLDLCANRASVGGAWEKFLVVDANNGYIALKSLNGNKYLNFWSADQAGHGDQDNINADDNQKFQWRNNGDGTVSLYSVGQKRYLCVDRNGETGDDPVKVYAN